MVRMMNEEWIKKIRETWKNDPYYANIIENCVLAKARDAISYPGIWRDDDINDYWRCLYRVADTALALVFTPDDQAMRKWLHDAVMEVCSQPADMWIGPFFRQRTNPPQGQLETTTMQASIFKPLVLFPELFSEEEKTLMLQRIREYGKPYTREWLDAREREGSLYHSNWTIAMLHGYTMAGLLLEEDDILDYVAECFNALVDKTMNSDFYGEATAYWGFAASSFSNVRLLLDFIRPDYAKKLAPVRHYTRMLPWFAAHHIGEYYTEASPKKVQRWLNISDADAMGSTNPTLLAAICYHREELPDLAPLAAKLFRNGSSPDFWAILLYPWFLGLGEPPVPPALQRFNNGETIMKHDDGLFFCSYSGSTEGPLAIAHRHADEGMIFAAYKTTVLLDDPGRCCYRLPLYPEGKQDTAHSLPFFTDANGAPLHQRIQESEDAHKPPLNQDAGHKLGEDWFYTTSDMGALYPETLEKVQRKVLVLGDHAALVDDKWQAKESIQAGVRFVGNNRMALMRWQIKGNEGRLSREGVGVRLISLDGFAPVLGYGTLHDHNSVNPAAPTQGRQGTAYEIIFNAPKPADQGTLRTLLIFDDEKRLDQWKAVQENDTLSVFDPDGTLYAAVTADKFTWHGKEEKI